MVNCSVPGCGLEFVCLVLIGGVLRAFCAAHIPSAKDAPFARDKSFCEVEGCRFRRVRGYKPGARATLKRCRIHALSDMIHAGKICDVPGCPINAIFAFPGNPPFVCRDHSEPGMVNTADRLCKECNKKQATHNYLSMKEKEGPLYCSEHARGKRNAAGEVMKNIKCGKCKGTDKKKCTKIPCYGEPGGDSIYCAECAHILNHAAGINKYVDVDHPKCDFKESEQSKECGVQSSRIVIDGEDKHYRCAKHCDGAPDKNKKCEFIADGKSCTLHPAYSFDDGAHVYCKDHAVEMALAAGLSAIAVRNIKSFHCVADDKRCSFALPGQPARFCKTCKPAGAVSVDSRTCIFKVSQQTGALCGTRACFALPGDHPQFCEEHARIVNEDMVNVTDRKCCEKGCKLIPSFGYSAEYIESHHEESQAPAAAAAAADDAEVIAGFNPRDMRCKKHVLIGMIDVRHPRCVQCGERAFYRVPGTKRTEYCYYCHPENAVSECTRCAGIDGAACEKRATHGPLFASAIHCAEHANVRDDQGHARFCEFESRFPPCGGTVGECPYRPVFSMDDMYKPTHCPRHAPMTAVPINLVTAPCVVCHIPSILNALTNKCACCELGTARPVPRKGGVKERRMKKSLETHGIVAIHNRQLMCDPALGIKSRPDFLIQCEGFAIILEVDEGQHQYAIDINELTNITGFMVALERADGAEPAVPVQRRGYTRDREITRMVEQQRAMGIPVVFIRYNPDAFVDDARARHIESRGPRRDEKAIEFVQAIRARATTRGGAPFDAPLCVAYIDYDGQVPEVPDMFSIDYDAERITRIPRT